MRVHAHLTHGWPAPDSPSADDLDRQAANDTDYAQGLLGALGAREQIHGVDTLFRRQSTDGADRLKRFLTALLSGADERRLVCHIDVFAYAFLKGAKNYDLFFPEVGRDERTGPASFRSVEHDWRVAIAALERTERTGSPRPDEQYLKVRELAARRTARDEWRALATLLWCGPSTLDEISRDLALRFTLAPRVLTPFVNADVVSKPENGVYRIKEEQLPLVVFFLRELLGLRPLEVLANG